MPGFGKVIFFSKFDIVHTWHTLFLLKYYDDEYSDQRRKYGPFDKEGYYSISFKKRLEARTYMSCAHVYKKSVTR